MKINNQKLVNRWNNIMNDICCEYICITEHSEICNRPQYYSCEEGITVAWMLKEAKYHLSCYYESGHIRYEDKFDSEEGYKTWLSETGKLKRLITALEKLDDGFVVEWE